MKPDDSNLSLSARGLSYADRVASVDLEIARGRCIALVGPSGAGKTTLLWLLAGLLEPTSGRVEGRDGARLGMVFQDSGLWDHLSAERHLALVGAAPDRITALLEQTGLTALRARRPQQMSGGERRRLALARALAVDPDWLLLDEPMAHLDGALRQDVLAIVRMVIESSRAGVLLATHHATEAMSLAHDIAIMIDAGIVQQGAVQTVYEDPVSLEAARTLGPASQFEGRIVRPEHLRFTPDEAGDHTVERCEYIGSDHLLTLVRGEARVLARTACPVPPMTRGRVVIHDPRSG